MGLKAAGWTTARHREREMGACGKRQVRETGKMIKIRKWNKDCVSDLRERSTRTYYYGPAAVTAAVHR